MNDLDKSILEQYLSLREEIVYYEGKLQDLKAMKAEIVTDTVTSSAEFPYSAHQVKITGVDTQAYRRRREKIERLEKQIQDMQDEALDLECEAFLFIQQIPVSLLRRIFIYKYLEELTWEQIGEKIHMHRSTAEKWVLDYLS